MLHREVLAGCTFQVVVALDPVANSENRTCGQGGLLLIQLEEGGGGGLTPPGTMWGAGDESEAWSQGMSCQQFPSSLLPYLGASLPRWFCRSFLFGAKAQRGGGGWERVGEMLGPTGPRTLHFCPVAFLPSTSGDLHRC